MSKEEIFTLYGKVLKGDKKAKEQFIVEYKKQYPLNEHIWKYAGQVGFGKGPSKNYLHTMYLHLYQ